MTLTQTKTSLKDLLSKRLEIWDKIDECYRNNRIVEVIQLENYVNDHLTPKIRQEYGL